MNRHTEMINEIRISVRIELKTTKHGGGIVEYEGFRCCVTTYNQNTDRNHFEYVLDKHHSVDRTV